MRLIREKLEELQAKGEDPFEITKYNRTHNRSGHFEGSRM